MNEQKKVYTMEDNVKSIAFSLKRIVELLETLTNTPPKQFNQQNQKTSNNNQF